MAGVSSASVAGTKRGALSLSMIWARTPSRNTPYFAQLSAATPAKISFSWGVFVVNTAGQRTRMAYRGVLFLQDNAFSVSARPTGFDNVFSARGNCKLG